MLSDLDHAPPPADTPDRVQRRAYIDLTHLGRHITGIERVSIEQFQRMKFDGADVRHVRSRGVLSMILRQQFLLPLLALIYPRAVFVFPGFPPSPLFLLARDRVVMYVHDMFLITRRQDLGLKAKLYMALPFRLAVGGLKYFLTNSDKTRGELVSYKRPDANVALYRPVVGNVFDLEPPMPARDEPASGAIDLIAIGTIEPRKNYAAAIAILDALAERGFQNARLGIIGREGWGNETALLRGDPRIRLLGYLSKADTKAAIKAADAYLCTSHDEGLGLPLIEVQFVGLPVIAPDAPVFREVLGASGTFIDTADAGATADAIVSLVSTRGWRTRSAAHAVANIERWNTAARGDAGLISGMLSDSLDRAAAWSGAAPGPARQC